MALAANTEKIKAQLNAKFGDDMDDRLLTECVSLCQMHNLDGEHLYFKWEALRFNRGPTQFTLKELNELKTTIQRENRANVVKKFGKSNLLGPQSKNFAASSAVRGGAGRLGRGVGRGGAVRSQDGFDLARLEDRKVPVAGPSRVRFVGPERKKRGYRYMYEKVSERSEALDKRIDHFGHLVQEYYGVEEFGDPDAITDNDVVVVGRITLDAESSAEQVKLNEASVMLESSRTMGSGARVSLRFDPELKLRKGKRGVGGLGIFPGAIVALKGKNGGGGAFVASEILSLPPLDPAPSTLVKSESGETGFSMCIACGPFTSDSDLQYRPLEALMTKLKSTKPAVVLLVGPFIDATHASIKTGDIDYPIGEMFRVHFLDRLRDYLDSVPGSSALLLPSTRDMLSDHVVFPQCELSHTLCSDPRIHFVPNPARFTVNGVHFAATSVDVLFHLRKEEFFKRAAEVDPLVGPVDPEGQSPSDPMANLCRHLLQQRSFYPIFPVPLDMAHEVNLDVTHSALLALVPEDDHENGDDVAADPSRVLCAPDVLIVPSRLKQFHKVVDNTVAINPSGLTKSTYAVLTYVGHTGLGPAKDRIKVDIDRLDSCVQ